MTDRTVPNVIRHIERHLGEIEGGWSMDADGNKLPFQVVLCSKGPIAGTKALVTVGLNRIELPSRVSKKMIRQELVILFRIADGEKNLPGVLQQVGRGLLQRRQALLRGEVVGPRDLIIEGGSTEALYASVPVYFPDSFASCPSEDGDIVFTWLVPITRSEAEYVSNSGWSAFEDVLQDADPDLLDFSRNSIV